MQNRKPQNDADFMAHPRVRKFVRSSALKLHASCEADFNVFMRILEVSMTQGRWNGFFPMES